LNEVQNVELEGIEPSSAEGL